MRKEILLAIVVGILAGLGVTYVVYTIRQTMLRSSTPSEIEQRRQQDSAPTPTPTSTSLSIRQPVPDFLTMEKSVRVVGKALPDSYIVVLAETGEFITTADKDGDFALSVDLQEGGNKLTIIATTPEGVQESAVATTVYITESVDPDLASTDDATTENE